MDSINRTFVGVRVPPDLFPVIDHALLQLKRKPGILDMRWSQPSEYLLNLVTLGELSIATMSRLAQAISPVVNGFSPLDLTLDKFGGIPNMIQPRFAVLQLGGPSAQNCIHLAQQLDFATKPLTPPREGRPFQPHIVLGRIRTESEQLRVSLGRALKFPEHEPFASWRIEQIELLISSADSSGVGYKVIESFPLRT